MLDVAIVTASIVPPSMSAVSITTEPVPLGVMLILWLPDKVEIVEPSIFNGLPDAGVL